MADAEFVEVRMHRDMIERVLGVCQEVADLRSLVRADAEIDEERLAEVFANFRSMKKLLEKRAEVARMERAFKEARG